MAGSWIRRLIQAVVSGIVVGCVYLLLVVSVYVGLFTVLTFAFASDPACRSFPNCTGPPPVNDPLSDAFGVVFTPVSVEVLYIVLFLAGAVLVFAVASVTEVLVWNGRRGWWWRSLLVLAPALLALFLGACVVVGNNDYTLAGVATLAVLEILFAGAVLTAVVAGLLPANRGRRDLAPAQPVTPPN